MAEIEFAGAKFVVADKVGLMPLMRFAYIAQKGVDSGDMEGLAAMYDMLRSVVADEEWGRFQEAATASRADSDDLLAVVTAAIAVISERPTVRPSDSSDGPPSTSADSAGDSSSRVVHRLERQGRPDLALMVRQAQGSRVSA